MESIRGNLLGDKYYYSSTLTLCLLSSLGICSCFLPSLPVNFDIGWSHKETTFVPSRIAMTVVILSAEVLLIRFIRSKNRFHQGQVVFWPMRCRHCARTLGLLQFASGGESFDENNLRDTGINSSALPADTNSSARQWIQADSSQHPDTYHMPEERPEMTSACQNQTQARSHQVSSKPGLKGNRSFVDVLGGFSCLAIVTVPSFAVGEIMCINANSTAPASHYITLCIIDFALISFLAVGIVFCYKYYDAIFVSNAENVFTILIGLSACIWLAAWKLVYPISGLLESEEQFDHFCVINGTLGNYFIRLQRAMIPFYMECSIIATGIGWQMWKSFIPRSVVRTLQEMPRYDPFCEATVSTPYAVLSTCTSVATSLPFLCRFKKTRAQGDADIAGITSTPIRRFVTKIWVASLLTASVYLASNMIVIFGPLSLSKHGNRYVLDCLEMAFCLPLMMIFLHMSISSKGIRRHTDLNEINIAHVPLEGHDVLLLLCTCGIFCNCFVRVAAAFGLLVSGQDVEPDETALFISALAHSVVIVVMVWCTTSFLLRVQRRPPQPSETKCVLALLIYIIVSYSTEWLIQSVYVECWTVEILFFGNPTGKVIGVLLDPFAILYGIHAAMVAYEAYRSVLSGSI